MSTMLITIAERALPVTTPLYDSVVITASYLDKYSLRRLILSLNPVQPGHLDDIGRIYNTIVKNNLNPDEYVIVHGFRKFMYKPRKGSIYSRYPSTKDIYEYIEKYNTPLVVPQPLCVMYYHDKLIKPFFAKGDECRYKEEPQQDCYMFYGYDLSMTNRIKDFVQRSNTRALLYINVRNYEPISKNSKKYMFSSFVIEKILI